jgi:itaconate CoA-transferase
MRKPLSGFLVVALEQAVAAPMCSRRLADAGARVIKLERPEGDFARAYDTAARGGSAYFVWLNRGKQSILSDLSKPADKALFEAMLAKADVFIQNLKPGALAKLGYPFEDLRRRFPRLVICSISGYGETGPYSQRKAYDLLIQAESGLASVTGGPESASRVGVSVVDIATGMNAYEAILEALIARGKTGEGADIRVSMFDAMAEWMTVPLLQGRAGNPPKRIGLAHPSVAPYGVFQTSSSVPILISIQNDREWVIFAGKVMEDAALAADSRLSNNVGRCAHRAEMDATIARWFLAQNHEAAIERLMRHEIAFGLVSDIAGLSSHPHLREVEVATPLGNVPLPAPPARRMGETETFGPVPALGQHTAAVRDEFLASPGASRA